MLMGDYTLIIEGFDWGPAVSRIVINLQSEHAGLDIADYTVFASRKSRDGSLVYSEGDRVITGAYLSDASGNKLPDGPCLTLTLQVGPDIALGSPFYYNQDNGLNEWVDCAYTITHMPTSFEWNRHTGQRLLIAEDFEKSSFMHQDITLTFASYTPLADKKPLIIWLHGAGEGGTDPDIVLLGNKVVNLAAPAIQSAFDGAYVLAPQCPTMWMDDGTGRYTADGSSCYTQALKALIDAYIAQNPTIDTSRIYIGGCSNGGFMTIKMLITYPRYFAAAFPVCEAYLDGWITDSEIESIKTTPIWFTHAANDNVVSPQLFSTATYKRLIDAGAENAHLTLWPSVADTSGLYLGKNGQPYAYDGHWSWLYTLNDECRIDYDGSFVMVNEQPVTIMQWLSCQSL